MLCSDYTSFVGQGTVLLLDTTDQIHAVAIDPPEKLSGGQALTQARDVVRFEVVSNASVWDIKGPRAQCPACDAGGCEKCRKRGWIPLAIRPALQVLTAENGAVSTTMLYLAADDSGRVSVSEVSRRPDAVGPMIDAVKAMADSTRSRIRLADLLVVWEAADMGEVLR